jgi:DNA-binding transcriptional LysR family regulator
MDGQRVDIARLRLLDFDDLYLLRHLLEGQTLAATARRLGLTQPAVTQRVRKIERVFEGAILERVGRNVRLTPEGRAVCAKAASALSLMDTPDTTPETFAVNLGAPSEIGLSWVWPTVSMLRKRSMQQVYHCYLGSDEEILRMLDMGTLDAIISSSSHLRPNLGSIEVASESFEFVAPPEIAAKVHTAGDLKNEILIEHNRSFPFLRYIDPQVRASLHFQDVWFLGSLAAMKSAILKNFGVGILPRHMIQSELADGQVKRILAEIVLAADLYRVIYRKDRSIVEAVEILAAALKVKGIG